LYLFATFPLDMRVLLTLVAAGLVIGGHHESHYEIVNGPKCHEKNGGRQCHKVPKQAKHEECHIEYDIVEHVTVVEECEYVVKTHCQEENEIVIPHHQIKGEESTVVDVEHESYLDRYKRSGVYHSAPTSHYSGPHCEDKKEHECHPKEMVEKTKVPKTICKTVVDTEYVEECVELFHTHCTDSKVKVTRYSDVVGHEEKKIHHKGYEHHEKHHDEYEHHESHYKTHKHHDEHHHKEHEDYSHHGGYEHHEEYHSEHHDGHHGHY